MDLTKDKQAVERIKMWLRNSVSKSLFLGVLCITFSRSHEQATYWKGKEILRTSICVQAGQDQG